MPKMPRCCGEAPIKACNGDAPVGDVPYGLSEALWLLCLCCLPAIGKAEPGADIMWSIAVNGSRPGNYGNSPEFDHTNGFASRQLEGSSGRREAPKHVTRAAIGHMMVAAANAAAVVRYRVIHFSHSRSVSGVFSSRCTGIAKVRRRATTLLSLRSQKGQRHHW